MANDRLGVEGTIPFVERFNETGTEKFKPFVIVTVFPLLAVICGKEMLSVRVFGLVKLRLAERILP